MVRLSLLTTDCQRRRGTQRRLQLFASAAPHRIRTDGEVANDVPTATTGYPWGESRSSSRPNTGSSRDALARLRLADLDQVAVGIADVAADLPGTVLRRREELRSLCPPVLVHGVDIRDPDVHAGADSIGILRVTISTSGLSSVGPPPTLMMIQE